jgi:CheY-like chemotaxis protein
MDRRIRLIAVPAAFRRSLPAFLFGAVIALAAGVPASAAPAEVAPGFTLRVGHQPFFAEAWSGALVRAQRLSSARLPAGVDVEFKIGTKGAGARPAQILDQSILKGPPVVILTASAEDADLVRTYELGVNSYVVQPVDFARLPDEVARLGYDWVVMNRLPETGS